MISFCTWIRNRFYQFERVYRINLARMRPQDEWVILDLESDDGMQEWAAVQSDPRIRYYRQPVEEMHFAKLYNRSHRLAAGRLLVTLDADNYIGRKFCDWATDVCRVKRFGHSWSNDWADGTYGRITMPREAFEKIGGFDEGMAPVGCQDTDYIRRAITAGYVCVTTNSPIVYGGSIPNPREATMQFLGGSVSTFDAYNKANAIRTDTHAQKRIFRTT